MLTYRDMPPQRTRVLVTQQSLPRRQDRWLDTRTHACMHQHACMHAGVCMAEAVAPRWLSVSSHNSACPKLSRCFSAGPRHGLSMRRAEGQSIQYLNKNTGAFQDSEDQQCLHPHLRLRPCRETSTGLLPFSLPVRNVIVISDNINVYGIWSLTYMVHVRGGLLFSYMIDGRVHTMIHK